MKIAILGKTRSRALAPFDDPCWTIWGMGLVIGPDRISLWPGASGPIGRWDAWFELHDHRDYRPDSPVPAHRAHLDWAKRQTKPIFTLGRFDVPAAVPLPRAALEARFGTYFLRNTICWAMAHALHLGALEIGLWGVEQAQAREYARERHGVQHFIHLARALGVPVRLPVGSPLARRPGPYPDPM